MAALSKTLRIGVIAEEMNDVEVLYEYTGKLLPQRRFSFMQFVGHGCGAIKRKSRSWIDNLTKRGCDCIVLLHDSDESPEPELRAILNAIVKNSTDKVLGIFIPIQELEAWLLADPNAIKRVFNMQKMPKIPKLTERIRSPKEYLGRIVTRGSKSHYINTIHNKRIASLQHISTLDQCPSFAQYPIFLTTAIRRAS